MGDYSLSGSDGLGPPGFLKGSGLQVLEWLLAASCGTFTDSS